MKKTRERFQNWMKAITFAEAGEWETAIRMTPAPQLETRTSAVEQTFMAAAFAEAGEWATALELAPPRRLNRKLHELDRTFMAATFAEAGLFEEAERIINKKQQNTRSSNSFTRRVGLNGARATFGILVAR